LARQGGFGTSGLTRSVFGSLIPGFQLGNSIMASFHPIPRWPAVVLPALLYALALLVFYRLCEVLFGARPLVVLLLAAAGLSGVLAISLVWWTAGLNSLPAVVCDLLALDGLVRHRLLGSRRALVVSAIAFAVGVAFYDSSSSFLVVLVVVNALFLTDVRTWRSLLSGFTAHWWVWAAYLVPIALNFGWRQAHRAAYALPPLPSVGNALRFIGAGWAQGFVPTSFGVNFDSLSTGAARLGVVVFGQLLFFGMVALTIWRRRQAWRAWVLFGSGFLAIEVVAAIGRGDAGTEFALNTVYWAVQPFLLALAVGLAVLPTPLVAAPLAPAPQPAPVKVKVKGKGNARELPPARWDRRVVAGALAATAALAALGGVFMWNVGDRAQGASARAYVATLSSSWQQVLAQHPDAFIWNTQVPPFVVTPLFVPYNRVGSTAGLLVHLTLDAAHGPGYVATATGALVPASVNVAGSAALGKPACFASQPTSRAVSVRLRQAVPVGNWFLRLRYAQASGFTGVLGGQPVPFARGSGTFLVPDSTPSVSTAITFTLPAHASVCITAADLEAPAMAGSSAA
ncbi:MAG TPA: hypothetical protein VGF87_03140, partial [Acidimicrobiales bacterium]